jgi:type I restriction enzyme M protein
MVKVIGVTLDTNIPYRWFENHKERVIFEELLDWQTKGAIEIVVTRTIMKDVPREPYRTKVQNLRELDVEIVGTVFRLDDSLLDGIDMLGLGEFGAFEKRLRSEFPNMKEPNQNDLDHIHAHLLNKRDVFLTFEKAILNLRERFQSELGVCIQHPEEFLDSLRNALKRKTKKASAKAAKSLEQTLWDAADKMRGNLEAGEYKHVVLGLVFLKYVSDAFDTRHNYLEAATADPNNSEYYVKNVGRRSGTIEDRNEYTSTNVFWVPEKARWKFLQDRAKQPEIGKLIDDAMDLIEAENPVLKGVLPKQYARAEIDKRLLGELVDLMGTIGFSSSDHGTDDVLGRVYEYFLGQFASSEGKRAGEYYTPRSVVQLLVEMLEPYHGRVYDPCCGSGGMFVQSAAFVTAHGGKRNDISVYGQEFTTATWRLAKMNLAIRGIEANLGDSADDSFHRDHHKDLRADFVIANPQFNVSDWYTDALRDDQRWKYGLPPAGNGNYAWIQHFIHHLAPNGVAGFVLANGSLSSRTSGEGEIRKKLIEANLVDCIVALPEKLFFNTGGPVCLWFVSKNRAGNGHRDRRGEVLFIDGRKLGHLETRKLRILSSEDIGHITGAYHNWRNRKPTVPYEDIAGFSKSATLEEVASHDHELTPGRYVGTAAIESDDEPIERKLARLRAQLLAEFDESDRLEEIIRKRLHGLTNG